MSIRVEITNEDIDVVSFDRNFLGDSVEISIGKGDGDLTIRVPWPELAVALRSIGIG